MAEPIRIRLKNNLRVTGIPSELRQILVDKLAFDNPKWIENNRMGRWNGGVPRKLKFYSKIKNDGLWIPRGFLRQLILLSRQQGLEVNIDDQRRSLPAVSYNFTGQLRPFQRAAVDRMLIKDFGTLSSPTGSGKTVMAIYMIAQRQQPALIIVHTKDLARQWQQRIETFLDIPAGQIGMIGGGKTSIGDRVTIAMVQSLYKCADEAAPHIGHLIVDECHRAPSRTFTEAVTEFDSRYMLGLSATPYRRDNLSRLIFWHLGDVHHQIDQKGLVKTGHVLQAEVIYRYTGFRPYFDPVREYSKMLAELTANDERNRMIAADVAREVENDNGVCLVLSDRKKHCQTLQSLLRFKHKLEADLLTGDLSGPERKQVIGRLDSGRLRVLVATGQLIGEGFDSRVLTTLFMATPVRFSGRVIQYVGRILRPAPGKDRARVYDYVDVHVEPLVKAARARKKVYGDA